MTCRLNPLPDDLLPQGCSVRTLTRADMPIWVDLLNRNGELGSWSAERAAMLFDDPTRLTLDASVFITLDGDPVGTAQLNPHATDEYAPRHELGWVAADPAYRGRGFGRAACLAVMRLAAAREIDELFLKTDDHRIPAIRTYLRLGFRPWPRDPTSPDRWRIAVAATELPLGAS